MADYTFPTSYGVGTATVTGGSLTVTGQGTYWMSDDPKLSPLRAGDLFGTHVGIAIRISDIVSDTELTLAHEWPGDDQTAAPYEIQLTPRIVGAQEATRRLLVSLANGNIEAFAALASGSDLIPIFTGVGTMSTVAKRELVNGVQYDVQVDELADRAAFDGQEEGYAVLVANVGDGRSALYTKRSNTSADWSDPSYITGPTGETGPYTDIAFAPVETLPPGSDVTMDVTPSGPNAVTITFGLPVGVPGDMEGPSGAVDGGAAVFDGPSGKKLKASTPGQFRTWIGYDSVRGSKIINGDGFINQQGVTSAGDDVYGHDQHYALTQTAAVTISTVSAPLDGFRSMMRILQAQSAAQRFGYAQIIEAAETYGLRGKPVTLGGKIRSSTAVTVRYAILEWTGTADVVTSDVVSSWGSGSFTPGGFFLASGLIVRAIGSIASTSAFADFVLPTTIGSAANNLIVMCWTESAQAQNVYLDLAWYLNEGDTTELSNPFVWRSVSTEMDICQRFWEPIAWEVAGSATAASHFVSAPVNFRSKRVTPSFDNRTVVLSTLLAFNSFQSSTANGVSPFYTTTAAGAYRGSGTVEVNARL